MPSSTAATSSASEDDDTTIATNNNQGSDKGSDSEPEISDDDDVEEVEVVEEEEDDNGDEEEGEEEEPQMEEYEEIEVEEEEEGEEEEEEEDEVEEVEEEEEEEEVEEEEEGDDEENPIDLSSPTKDDRNDYNQEEGHVDKLEKSKPTLVSDTCGAKDSGGHINLHNPSNEPLETKGKELSHVEKEALIHEGRDEVDCSNQDHSNNKKSTHAEKSKSSCFDEKATAAESLKRDGSDYKVSNSVLHLEEKSEQMDIDSKEDVKLRASSSITPQTRPRSLSPGVEFEDKNKKPAIMCDFFARGWCIKGNSCRFLHQKDGVDNTSKYAKGDVPIANSKSELKAGAGFLRQEADKSNSSAYRFLDKHGSASPVVQGNFSKFVSPSSGGPANPFPSELDWKFPLLHDIPHHQSDFMGSKGTTGEEFVRHRPVSSGSFIYGNNSNSLPSTGMSPLQHTFSWPGTSPSKGSSAFGGMKALDGEGGYYASRSSLPRSSSSPLYLRSEQENLSIRSSFGDPLISTGHITQFTSYRWEPSVPFRPSFHLPSVISSPGTQYDPLRDSIEPLNGGDSSFQSPFSKGIAIRRTSSQMTNGDSVSLHQQPQNAVSDKNTHIHDSGAYTTSAEAPGAFMAEEQNRTFMVKEEKPVRHHVRNASNAKEVDLDHNPAYQVDGGKNNKESKTLKLFRASLVDFVKELVKPSWREGHLSKDAHNMVVKKAVEKVLSTLQPHQIPTTAELTNQYLSLSQPKIAKLVEGYVGKYAKA